MIIGQGYVGLPLAMAVARSNRQAVGLDVDLARVTELQLGRSPIRDVASETLARELEQGRYMVTTDYGEVAGFTLAVITVPTPLRDGKPDLSYVESAAKALAPHISLGSAVILESTTYPGTTEELLVPILENGSGMKATTDFFVGYSPERIDPGNPQWNLLNTPKVVSGIDQRSTKKVNSFYSSLGIPTVVVSGTREAELTKLLENTFRHVNIALVNELAMFSRALGANIWEAIDAASTKPFGYMKFTPGPGVGGHCLPIDPSYLSWAVEQSTGRNFRFIELANSVNAHMPEYVVTKAVKRLADRGLTPNESRIILFGLSYKANTSDLREAPALVVAELLQNLGADVFAVDNLVSEYAWPEYISRPDKLGDEKFQLGILLTSHDGVADQVAAFSCDEIIDTLNVLPAGSAISL